MKHFEIFSASGTCLGVYQAHSEEEALEQMAKDAGYRDQDHVEEVTGKSFDGEVMVAEEGKYGNWYDCDCTDCNCEKDCFSFSFKEGVCSLFRGDVEIDSCSFEGKNAADDAASWAENRAVDFGWNPEEGEELPQK